MIVNYYKWRIGMVINQAKELPDGIIDFEIIPVDESQFEPKTEILSEISPAKFYLGLDKQGVTESDVLFFIENYIQDVGVKTEARILFQKANEFEYGHELLNQFIPIFNQYLISKEKTPISLDQIFLT